MKRFLGLTIAAAVILFVGCAPFSKESYLSRYEQLVNEAADVHKDCSQIKWAGYEESFEKFSTEYYDKFKGELTGAEKLKVVGYESKFIGYRALRKIHLKTNKKSEAGQMIDNIVDDVKNYIDEGLEKDVQSIKKDVEKTIDEISETIEDHM